MPVPDARTIAESTLEQVLVNAINQALSQKGSFLVTLQENIETVLAQGNSQVIADIDTRLAELQEELVKLANSKADYENVGDEIYRLREEKQTHQLESAGRDEVLKRISEMSDFLQGQPTEVVGYDESLVRRLVDKVTVYEDRFTVEFKSGVTIETE